MASPELKARLIQQMLASGPAPQTVLLSQGRRPANTIVCSPEERATIIDALLHSAAVRMDQSRSTDPALAHGMRQEAGAKRDLAARLEQEQSNG